MSADLPKLTMISGAAAAQGESHDRECNDPGSGDRTARGHSATSGRASATHAIRIQELRKSYGLEFSLGPITLNIPRGVICGLVGPNGAGKTTLLNLLMGIGMADSGTASLVGHDVRENEVEVKRRVALVSPDLSYRAWGTVGRAIDFVRGFYPDWNAERCEHLLFQFDVHRSERVDALSFGARVKLAAVMALSRDPELLLLDEPTAGLDPLARQQLFAELLAFMRDENRTIVISSHNLTDLERFADHVAVMQQGQIIAFGAIPDLLERYVQLDVQLPSDDSRIRALKVISRQENRARLLFDRWGAQSRESLDTLGVEVLGETALTLEELFVALMKTGRTRWQPRLPVS
jgi:ABC-2 type transport system ATP-binding protein